MRPIATLLATAAFAGAVGACLFTSMAGSACRIADPAAAEVRFNLGHGCEARAAGGAWTRDGQPGGRG